MLLPAEAQPLRHDLAPAFTDPTYHRFATLTAAAILTTGRRTVANLLRTVGRLAPGHPASYRRVLSAAQWSGLELGCALARFLLDRLAPDGPVDLVGDDTVYGKGRHRGDAVRSSHSYTAWRYGHKWGGLAVLVKFPFAARRWARPVLVDLYRNPEVSKAEGVRHKTPAQLMCRLLRLPEGKRAGSVSWPGKDTETFRTPSPPSAGGPGPRAFSHRPGWTGTPQNSQRTSGNCCYPASPRPNELHKPS